MCASYRPYIWLKEYDIDQKDINHVHKNNVSGLALLHLNSERLAMNYNLPLAIGGAALVGELVNINVLKNKPGKCLLRFRVWAREHIETIYSPKLIFTSTI